MPWTKRVRSLARNLLHRARFERDLDDEASSILELLTQEKIRRGDRPEEARRAARIELGGLEQLKESVRGARAGAWVETLGQNLRHGARMLRKNPGFAAVAALTLALGIGANTAIFSVLSAVLLRPLPYPHPERLVLLWTTSASEGIPLSPTAAPDFREWRKQSRLFADMGAFSYGDHNLSGGGLEPERVQGAEVSASLFPTLGVQTARGRVFVPDDEQFGRHRVVVLAHGLWVRRFGGRPDVVGRRITLDGESYTVVGVMPQGMPFLGNVPEVELWVPLAFAPNDSFNTRGNRFLLVVARLKPGADPAAAQAEMSLIAGRIAREDRENAGYGAQLVPLREQLVGRVRAVLLVLFGAVGCLLLIACANVANLLLARAAVREKEFALRASLGAGRGRLLRQLLLENLPLGLLGGAAGVALAKAGQHLLQVALLPPSFPRFNEIAMDGRVLAFTLAVSLLTATIFGLAPAIHAVRLGLRGQDTLHGSLMAGSRTLSAGARRRCMRSVLVVTEIALALVLLIGAGLLLKSFVILRHLDPGFTPAHVLTMQVPLPPSRYPLPTLGRPSPDRAVAFFDQLVESVGALPGVAAAGIGTQLPLGVGTGWGKYLVIEGRPSPGSLAEVPTVSFKLVSPGFFGALGYRLRGGRFFTARDTAHSQPVAIVNETFAKRYFAGASDHTAGPDLAPVGKSIVMDAPPSLLPPAPPGTPPTPHRTIVGVVADVKNTRTNTPTQPEVYAPVAQNVGEGWFNSLMLAVRTTGEPASLLAAVQAQVRALDADQPVAAVATMEEHLRRSLSQPRFGMLLLALFAGVALLLAVLGVYGLVSYEARQRIHEIGIRTAIGARPSSILALVVGDGLKLALLGAAIGVAASLALVRLLSSLLYGVGQYDPATFLAMPAILVAAALLAAYLPARKAARIDPIAALRHE